MDGLFFEHRVVVKRVAPVVSQVQLVGKAQGFCVDHPRPTAHAQGGVVQAHPNSGCVVVFATAVSHDPVKRCGADRRHGLHLHHAVHRHGLGDASNRDHLG